MQIKPINNCQNFTGIYRIPINALYNEETIDILRDQYYERKCDDVVSVIGETPFSQALDEKIQETAEEMGYSEIWLRQNAEKHGLDLSHINSNYVMFVTGKKDINELLSIVNGKNTSYKTSDEFMRYANRVYEPPESLKDIFSAAKYPSYLYDIASRLKAVNRYTQKFLDLMGHKIKDVSSEEELVKEMFQ